MFNGSCQIWTAKLNASNDLGIHGLTGCVYLTRTLVVISFSTENGAVGPNENKISMPEVLNDEYRIEYLTKYADEIAKAIHRGVPVKSHLMWALTDNFECKSRAGVREPSACADPVEAIS